ncbi:uncharacterized protein LOC134268356 [Saccostrea cucullata]|uniref:uncharacterized protein LOC134268356 n=1 Tax=Saccostrea cuccullata TaxID=36930 RepID=UPI002ED368D1
MKPGMLSILVGFCLSVNGELTIEEIRKTMQEFIDEKCKDHVEEVRLLREEVTSLRSSQIHLETEQYDMVSKIKKLSNENEQLKKSLKQLRKDNVGTKNPYQDKLAEKDVGEEHEIKDALRAKSRRIPVSSGILATSIAFSASLAHNIANPYDNEIFVFDRLITNSGNAYNKNNGMFTAPIKGIYAFFSSVLTLPGKSLEAQIVKNGNAFCNLYAGNTNFFGPGFNMAIIELEVGDAVWVKIHDKYHDTGITLDGAWTTFSGILLNETE